MSEHAIDGHLVRSNSTIFAASLQSIQSPPFHLARLAADIMVKQGHGRRFP